jgi:hypothetical protein
LVKEVQDYTESTEKSVHQFQDPKWNVTLDSLLTLLDIWMSYGVY